MGLPETAEFGSIDSDLHLYYDDVYSLPGPERIEWARRAEAAAMAADPRITNSDGGSFDAATGTKGAGQFARIRWWLSIELCRRLNRSFSGGCERPDAARWLVGRALGERAIWNLRKR